jgi:AraC family transcriptional regulator, alkane utilization regulator
MDTLSELLKTIRLTGALYVDARLRAPWSYLAPPASEFGALVDMGADYIVPYHVVIEGRCIVKPERGAPVELVAGDVIALPRGEAHVLCSSLDVAPELLTAAGVAEPIANGSVTPARNSSPGEAMHCVCGCFAFDCQLSAPLIGALPDVLRVALGDDSDGQWLVNAVRCSVAESALARTGAGAMRAKLSELLFIETIRRHLEQLPANQTGWLAGLRDPQVAKALALMHAQPEHPWTLEELARRAGSSRSSFADRFTQYLGQPPMQYLTRWRLALAADRLRDGRSSISRVAERAGYDSETSFTRAFKREFGMPPSQWRRANGSAVRAGPRV